MKIAGILFALVFASTLTPARATTQSDQLALGRHVYDDLKARDQIVTDSPYNAVLQRVGKRISAAAQPHWFVERFFVVRGNQMNAFSAPGGYVFVNEGLLRSADNVDELANVLGHETAHLVLGHLVVRAQQEQRRNFFFKLGHLLVNSNSQASQKAFNAANTAGNYTFLGFTRQQEYDADRVGATLAARAGFNPWGTVWFFDEVYRLYGDAGYEQYVQQHPSTRDRIARVEQYLRSHHSTFGRWRNRMPPSSGLPTSE